jgi:hypothetical protein
MRHVFYNLKELPTGVEELEALVGKITFTQTDKSIVPKFNPYHNQIWGDFDWLRSLFPKDATTRCYITTKEDMTAKGIKGHLGMYDVVDGDKVHDFYFALPAKLDKRAITNGFASNLAWLYVHEYCHGREKFAGGPDRTHEMEKQGRLKELLKEHQDKEVEKLSGIVRVLQYIVSRFKNPNTLQPLVARRAQLVIDDMAKAGHRVRIAEGYRSTARQAELYAQGRTKPGQIVTNARPGESFHNYGVAVDFVFVKEGYSASDELWQVLGEVMERHGFDWGGNWKGFVDRPHGELTLGYSIGDFQQGKVDYKKYI